MRARESANGKPSDVAGSLPETSGIDFGYVSPAAALVALRAKAGVSVREENDWYVLNDPSDNTFWSITRPGHPAHPAAVKRMLVDDAKGVHMAMSIKCGSTKLACDQLVLQFKQINEDFGKSLRQ